MVANVFTQVLGAVGFARVTSRINAILRDISKTQKQVKQKTTQINSWKRAQQNAVKQKYSMCMNMSIFASQADQLSGGYFSNAETGILNADGSLNQQKAMQNQGVYNSLMNVMSQQKAMAQNAQAQELAQIDDEVESFMEREVEPLNEYEADLKAEKAVLDNQKIVYEQMEKTGKEQAQESFKNMFG